APRRHRVLLRQPELVAVAPRRRVAAHWPARHRLDAAADHQVLHAGQDYHGGERHRLLTTATKPVEREAGCLRGPSGGQHSKPADARAVVADAVAIADDHVLDGRRLDADPRSERSKGLGQKLLWVEVV